MKWQLGISALLLNSLKDFRDLCFIFQFKNIYTGILSLVLMLWKFVTMYDNTDMRK